MSGRKRTRKAPRRQTRPSEIRFPVEGHTAGAAAFIAIRRSGRKWAIVDNNGGARNADYFDGRGDWHPLLGGVLPADAYRWTEEAARARALRFAAEAAEIHRYYLRLPARPAQVRRVTPQQPPPTVSVPAPMDHPRYEPEPPDPEPAQGLLSRIARDIPANCEDKTAALDVRRLHGAEVTQEMPTITAEPPAAAYPPMPSEPPALLLPAAAYGPIGWNGMSPGDEVGYATADLKDQAPTTALPRRGFPVRLRANA